MDIFLPVMESSVVLAAQYAKACNRTIVQPQDMHYGMMFAARNVLGKQIGSLYPEVYDEDGEEEEEEEVEEEEEEPWTRYEGTENDFAMQMNACAESWDAWVPESPAENALKNAVNKAKEKYV